MVAVNPKKNSRIKKNDFHLWSYLFGICSVGAVMSGFLTLFGGSDDSKSSSNVRRMSNRFAVDVHSASHTVASGKPYILYGTAWKKESTARYVNDAIHAGFRFIDTAGQPKHYFEAGVGDGWTSAARELGLGRTDFWLQTKFTPPNGQDPKNMPYDDDASLEDQVRQSFQSSLRNLKTDYVDSLVLHSPLSTIKKTVRVWHVFEDLVDQGKVHRLGISNCYDLDILEELYYEARIKPSILQNRFYEDSNFDVDLRHFCENNQMTYQSFWTLTANRHALSKNKDIARMAKAKNLTPQTLMYAFMMTLGHTPLSGTTSTMHMEEDVAVMQRIQGGEEILSPEEVQIFSVAIGIPEDELDEEEEEEEEFVVHRGEEEGEEEEEEERGEEERESEQEGEEEQEEEEEELAERRGVVIESGSQNSEEQGSEEQGSGEQGSGEQGSEEQGSGEQGSEEQENEGESGDQEHDRQVSEEQGSEEEREAEQVGDGNEEESDQD